MCFVLRFPGPVTVCLRPENRRDLIYSVDHVDVTVKRHIPWYNQRRVVRIFMNDKPQALKNV